MKPSIRNVFGILSVVVLAVPPLAESREIIVSQDGQGEFTTLSAAIEASSEGDTLLVHEGEYTEAITLKNNQSLIGEGSVILSNPEGTTITTSANNIIQNIDIIESGLHAIAGNDVESIEIENVNIQEFNLLKQIARLSPTFEYEEAYEAILLVSSGDTEAVIELSSVQITDGFGGGIRVSSNNTSFLTCTLQNIQVKKIDASSFIEFPPSFSGSPGFAGLSLRSSDESTLSVTIETMLVQEVGFSSDGILADANDTSTLQMDVRKFTYDDPTDISGPISEGINVGANGTESTMLIKVEESNFLNSNNAGFSVFNWSGTNNGTIDLGGGELGSAGLNRFIGNQFHFDGAYPNPITAKNNYWGNPDGFLNTHVWQGAFDIDNIPYMESDPRAETSGIQESMWQIYE